MDYVSRETKKEFVENLHSAQQGSCIIIKEKEKEKTMANIPKIKRHTRHQKYVIAKTAVKIGVVVIAVVGLIIAYLALFTNAFSPFSGTTKTNIPVDAKITATEERIYYFSGSTLTSVDRSGKTVWQSKFTGSNLKVSASNQLVCVYTDTLATVMDKDKNILYTVPSDGFVLKETQCGNSSVALLCTLEDTENMEYVRVFDQQGSEIYRSTHDNISVLDFGLTGVNDNLWELTLDTTGVEPISRISISAPAQNALTGTVEITDQLVSDLYFFDSDMYVSGTNSLTQYDTFGNKGTSTLIYGQKCIDSAYSGKNYSVLFVQRDTEKISNVVSLRVLAKTESEETDSFLQTPADAVAIHTSTNYVYCFLKNKVQIYELTGKYKEELDLDLELSSTKKITSDEVLLYTDDTVYIMNLN